MVEFIGAGLRNGWAKPARLEATRLTAPFAYPNEPPSVSVSPIAPSPNQILFTVGLGAEKMLQPAFSVMMGPDSQVLPVRHFVNRRWDSIQPTGSYK